MPAAVSSINNWLGGEGGGGGGGEREAEKEGNRKNFGSGVNV